jgi:hypothetical protein
MTGGAVGLFMPASPQTPDPCYHSTMGMTPLSSRKLSAPLELYKTTLYMFLINPNVIVQHVTTVCVTYITGQNMYSLESNKYLPSFSKWSIISTSGAQFSPLQTHPSPFQTPRCFPKSQIQCKFFIYMSS